jgi:hypothetical protein
MVACALTGNISGEATNPLGNILREAMRQTPKNRGSEPKLSSPARSRLNSSAPTQAIQEVNRMLREAPICAAVVSYPLSDGAA